MVAVVDMILYVHSKGKGEGKGKKGELCMGEKRERGGEGERAYCITFTKNKAIISQGCYFLHYISINVYNVSFKNM